MRRRLLPSMKFFCLFPAHLGLLRRDFEVRELSPLNLEQVRKYDREKVFIKLSSFLSDMWRTPLSASMVVGAFSVVLRLQRLHCCARAESKEASAISQINHDPLDKKQHLLIYPVYIDLHILWIVISTFEQTVSGDARRLYNLSAMMS